jgi:Tfp pilus assembly protein FimV
LLPLPAQLQAELDQLRAQLQVKDEQLQAKDEQLQAKDEQLQAKDEQIGQMLRLLRDQVEVQARVQSRQDILDQPADTTEVARLSRWIAELRTP